MDLKAVYHVLHSLTLFIYATFVWICTYVTESKNIIYRFRDGALNSTDAPFLMLDKPIQNLDHLAFVIYEDNVSIPTLCHLIIICINLQIRDISITAKSSKLLLLSLFTYSVQSSIIEIGVFLSSKIPRCHLP